MLFYFQALLEPFFTVLSGFCFHSVKTERSNDLQYTVQSICVSHAHKMRAEKFTRVSCAFTSRLCFVSSALHLATHTFTFALSCMRKFSDGTTLERAVRALYMYVIFSAVKIGCWKTQNRSYSARYTGIPPCSINQTTVYSASPKLLGGAMGQ